MEKRHHIGIVFALVAALGVALVFPAALHAFGVSPGEITENRLVPGSTVTRTISLVQGNPEADAGVIVLVDSKDIKDWISFEQGTEFVIPAGVQQFPLNVTIAVPKNADLGNYSAFIRVRTRPAPATEGGSVAVAVGARVDVNLVVGNNVIEEFKVKALSILDIVEGKPLSASARIENTGNVPTGPDSASFELFDKFGNIRLAFSTIDGEVIGKVEPFVEKSVTLKFPIDLRIAPGAYRGHVKVFDENGDIVREVKTGFTVRERTLADILVDLAPYLGGGLVLLIIIVVGLLIRRRRKQRLVPADVSEDTVHV